MKGEYEQKGKKGDEGTQATTKSCMPVMQINASPVREAEAEALANGLGTWLDGPVCNRSAAVCSVSPVVSPLAMTWVVTGDRTTRKSLTRTRIEVIKTSLRWDEDSSKVRWMESDYKKSLVSCLEAYTVTSTPTAHTLIFFVSKLKSSNYSLCSSLGDFLVETWKVGVLIRS